MNLKCFLLNFGKNFEKLSLRARLREIAQFCRNMVFSVFKALHLTIDTGYYLSDTFPTTLKYSTFILRGDLALER